MIKNKSLFKNISLFFCLIPLLLLSLFCLFPKNDKYNVSALGDQVITNFNFVGANIFVPMTMQNLNNNSFDRQSFTNLSLNFGLEDGLYRASIHGYVNNPANAVAQELGGVLTNVPNQETIVSRSVFLKLYVVSDTTYGYNVIVSHSGQLTSDIVKVNFSSYQNLSPNIIKPANYYNTITYFDINGEFITFEFPLFTNGASLVQNFLFEDRVYYFTASFDDNAFYNEGYLDGLDQGLQDGYENGYQSGLDIGSQSGYQDGFSAGVRSANDYSFIGLLGAVIDAPVTAFTGLLNFEILGFNILAFVTGLITLALIIFIVKLCIGGK